MNTLKTDFVQTLKVVILALLFSVGASLVYAQWTGPTLAPPGGNVGAPLNITGSGQTKVGGLILNTGAAQYGLLVADGNVGVGTLTPTSKLEVDGDLKTGTFILDGVTSDPVSPSTGEMWFRSDI